MNKIKFKRFTIVGLILALVLSVSGCKKEEAFVAKVNGEGITQQEFDSDFQVYKKIYEQQLGENAMSQAGEDGKTLEESLKEDIVEKLIMEKIVAQEAKKMDINVTSEEIQEQMGQYIAAMGGQEKFDEFLKSNEISKEFFEENLKKELLFNKHREAFMNNTTIDEKEAKDYFEANKDDLIVVRASHILVKTEEEGKEVLKRLNGGEEFSKLALELSIDKASAEQGGDLGYFGKRSMIAEFQDAAFALNVGETSGLVKTEVGYHIIRVEDRKDTYESLKDDMTSILKENKYLEKIQELRESAKVKVFLDNKAKTK